MICLVDPEQFDDVQTVKGWADVPSNYSFLDFHDFHVFEPSDTALADRISKYDLNCAVSKPNALYGGRPLPISKAPHFQIRDDGNRTFSLHSLKIKPLDMPFGYAKVSVEGFQNDTQSLDWNVDFPAGFHDPLEVDLVAFSRQRWEKLVKVEIRADFYNGGIAMDWEFCIDDMKVSFQSTTSERSGNIDSVINEGVYSSLRDHSN